MKNYLILLRLRPQFRYLWLAQVISLTGDWFNTIASVILINRYTDSSLAVGGLFLARALPPFLVGPFAGVVADRFNRKAVLIISDLLRAGIVLCFLFVDRPERAWLLYFLSIVQFTVSAFFEPARAAILPTLVAEDELLAANTLSSTTWSAMLTLGAAIGGAVAAVFGAQIALMVDSLSFILSALLVLQLVMPQASIAPPAHRSGWADFIAGLGYVRQHPRVGVLTLVKVMGQIGSIDVIAAIYAERVFHFGQDGAATLGAMLAGFGVGAVAGPLVGNLFHDHSTRMLKRAIVGGYIAIVIAWVILGLSPTLSLVLVGCVLRGMGASLNWTYSDVLLQMAVPNHFLGRVYALDFGIFTLAMSVSVWLTGLALDQYIADPRLLAIVLAAIAIAPVIIWGRAMRWQTIEA